MSVGGCPPTIRPTPPGNVGTALDALQPEQVGTRLITNPDEPEALTLVCETDARTALTRGLAEYFSTLRYTDYTGVVADLKEVQQTWAMPNVPAQYPGACVYSAEAGEYEASKMSGVGATLRKLADNVYLGSPSEYKLPMFVDAYCTDPEQRMAVATMIELGMNPVDWMYGVRLELGHYFGVRAEYALLGTTYLDTEQDATQGWRILRVLVAGIVPYVRRIDRPGMLPRARAEVR